MIKNKKGDATDSLTFAFWMFVFAIFILVLVFALLKTFTLLSDSPLADDNSTRDALVSATNYVTLGIPGTYIIIFFGLLLSTLISSFFIRVHYIFIPIYIISGMLSLFVAVPLGNAWSNLTELVEFQEILELNVVLGLIDLIMNNIVKVTLLVFILSLIIVFAKPGSAQSQQPGGAPF